MKKSFQFTTWCSLLLGAYFLFTLQTDATFRQQPTNREVAITFDDLPGVQMKPGRFCDPRAFAEMNRRLLQSLTAQRVPALGLVVESRLCERHRGTLPALLRMWVDAGLELGNHSFSHPDLCRTRLPHYQADIIRGEATTRRLLRERGRELRYFRHPFLHTGKDLETKRALESFLAGRGYQLAPVTIDNQEWVFAAVYAAALGHGDEATAQRVAAAYLTYMGEVFDFFERRSVEVVGYEIRQVLLLHVNPLNADYFNELAGMMKQRGYRFIALERALEDPAYRLVDTYVGERGLSWIHRWALSKGMELREEPREPEFIASLYRKYMK